MIILLIICIIANDFKIVDERFFWTLILLISAILLWLDLEKLPGKRSEIYDLVWGIMFLIIITFKLSIIDMAIMIIILISARLIYYTMYEKKKSSTDETKD